MSILFSSSQLKWIVFNAILIAEWHFTSSSYSYRYLAGSIIVDKSSELGTSSFICCCFASTFSYISRYHFLLLLRTSFIIFWKKICVLNFPFLTQIHPNSHYHHNGQNLLSVTIFFCWCSLIARQRVLWFCLCLISKSV